jgi:translation initiation factor 2 alpha subunit (eIF-2alpha)
MRFYKNLYPNKNDNVLVKFTMKEDYVEGELLEYNNIKGIMILQDATKKRKIKSWNNIISKRPMVARVQEVDIEKNLIQLSIAYYTEEQTQEKLLEDFTKNNIFVDFIKSCCIKFKYDFDTIWKTYIYDIHDIRENENIWDFFCNNIDNINIEDNIKEALKIKIKKKEETVKTEINIISLDGIESVKKLLETINEIIKNTNNYEYNLKYISTPRYILETQNSDDATNYIETLKTNNKNKNIFIKI